MVVGTGVSEGKGVSVAVGIEVNVGVGIGLSVDVPVAESNELGIRVGVSEEDRIRPAAIVVLSAIGPKVAGVAVPNEILLDGAVPKAATPMQ